MTTNIRPKSEFKSLGGSDRKYLDVKNNVIISRAKYLDYTRGEGWRSERKGDKQGAAYRAMVRDFKRIYGKDAKVRGPDATAFKMIVEALKSKDNSPKGIKAQALAALGRRPADADYDVGKSPVVR